MDIILGFLPLICAVIALITLVALTIIDFRTWLLPDKLNLVLALSGLGFHAATGFTFLSPAALAIGAATGGGILLAVRTAGNYYYKQDTLGLGDVKLLAAAGVWLGAENVVIALTIGACAGLVHGILVGLVRAIRERAKPNFKRLMIPAGPGFCVGILACGLYAYLGYFMDYR